MTLLGLSYFLKKAADVQPKGENVLSKIVKVSPVFYELSSFAYATPGAIKKQGELQEHLISDCQGSHVGFISRPLIHCAIFCHSNFSCIITKLFAIICSLATHI